MINKIGLSILYLTAVSFILAVISENEKYTILFFNFALLGVVLIGLFIIWM